METHGVFIVVMDVVIASWLVERLINGYQTKLIGNLEFVALGLVTLLAITLLLISMFSEKQWSFTSCCDANCVSEATAYSNCRSIDCGVEGQVVVGRQADYTISFFSDEWAYPNQQRLF